MKIEEVPELTLPIIKPNRDYFCQYCDKVEEPVRTRVPSGSPAYSTLSACINKCWDLSVTLNSWFPVSQ